MKWILTIKGTNEIFENNRKNTNTINYEHVLYFENFKEVVDFIILNQMHSNQNYNYLIEFI